jgi:hypothetical protein
VTLFDLYHELEQELGKELSARQAQFEYYRNRWVSFAKAEL